MNYWLTTHWPRTKDESIEEPPSGLWVRDGQRNVIGSASPGDRVFIYEARTGPTVIRKYSDGSTREVPRRHGREGLVALVEVIDRATQPEDSNPERYADGTTRWWRYRAPTVPLNSAGYLPRPELNRYLGYSPNYTFRGFGEDHSGVKRISQATYDRLSTAFLESSRAHDAERVAHASTARLGGCGEGAEHLALKKQIVENPAMVLGEPGLRLWKEEWLLPTMDRIDIVLKDGVERFVAVEVEVDCDANELAGPLQCMKYRAMLSYFFGRPLKEVRCILVAHSIDNELQQCCYRNGIESRVVGRG